MAYNIAPAKQDTLVSGTNIKSVNSTTLLGSGNLAVQEVLVSGTNIKSVNSTTLLGSGDLAVQEVLVSGTNLKSVNSTSLLGSGNLAVQEVLVSGTNIKSVNSTTLLGSGDLAVQDVLVSGTNIKTINTTSLLGSGDITVANSTLSNLASPTAINQTLLFGSDNTFDIGADGASRPGAVHAASHLTAPTVRARDNVSGAGAHDITVRGGNGTTGNKDGGVLTLAGGTASGSGVAGTVLLQTAGVTRVTLAAGGTMSVDGQIDFNNSLVVNAIHAQTGTANVITATTTNYYIGVDSTLAAKTVNLPAASSCGSGFTYKIKDESGTAASNNITIDADGSETIDGQTTAVIAANYGSLELVCNGSNWFIA